MQLKYIKTLLPAQDGAAKICSIAWSLNNKKLSVCTYDRVVFLFDEFGEIKDKFSTRPCDPKYGKKSYMVKCLGFSPDASKIAVGQTDSILFVYKIGDDWGEKKTICNKFIYNGAVTCLLWLPDGQLIYGTSEGKVRLANTRTNKSSTLYDARSYALSMTACPSGKAILSGHADGSIVKFIVIDDGSGESSGKVCIHPSPPYALAWGTTSFLAAGCDKRVFVYSKEGRIVQQFDYNKDKENEEKEFTCAVCSPSGQSIVVGSYDRLRVYNWSPRKGLWDEGPPKEIKNLYTITALAWKVDGSKLYAGSLCGAVEVFDCCLKRNIYKNKFEISYVGVSQVVIKSLVGKQSLNLKSRQGNEITEVKIVGNDRYVLGHTTDTLILADMVKKTSCEVPWLATGGNEKYSFDNENICIVSNSGELTLIEYGKNEILGSVRTEFTNRHLLSVRINERKQQDKKDNKKIAYLVDLKTIAILDLVIGVTMATVNHDFKIGWLELNETGHKLLFRDVKLKLHLYDVETQMKTTILNYCSYVQWVPGSDVVVAQSREDLFIWYNIETPEKTTTIPIKGDVVDIERSNGRTEVIVSEKSSSSSSRHLLDEGMIEFRTAIDDRDFARAVSYLESLEMTPETEALWQRLSNLSMEAKELLIAERCYAALGNVAKARVLNEINTMEKELRDQGGLNNYKIQAKMAILEKNFKLAESIYLDQNNVDEAIKMYQDLHKWEDAIMVAEAMNHPNLETLRKKFYLWTMESGQEHKAAEMKERSGDYEAAAQLYIKAGLPARAAKLVTSRSSLMNDLDLIQRVTNALVKAEMFDKVGDLYEKLGRNEGAIEFYCKGHCYQKAVELARVNVPQIVVKLEEQWGNYLVTQKKYDSAINHFIESGSTVKALEAAINSHQWKKATQILEVLSDRPDMRKYHLLIAQHFVQIGNYQEAEKLFMSANCINEAIEMYSNAEKWDLAHKLASKHMDIDKVNAMSLNQAKILEEKGKLREAERLYIAIDKADEAITMYKRQKMYEEMLRMVKIHRPNHIRDTHLYLAKLLEGEGKLKLSEHHLIEAKDVDGAIRLYAKEDKWEDAYRVAKSFGGPSQQQRVAYEWARSVGGESAMKLLNKLGMLESTLNMALKSNPPDFEFAFELAKGKDKMPYVSERYAEYLEENGRYREAEAEFIKAGIPKNAVLMYVSCKDWDSAQRVAELYDKSSVSDVMTAQGHVAFENGEFQKAESFFLRAQRPTLIVQRYKEANMWADALRVCKEYLPNILPELQNEFESKQSNESFQSNIQSSMQRAQEFEAKGEYARAVKSYVDVTSQSPDDVVIIEKCYRKATQLALKFLSQENLVRVVEVVGPRLVELRRFNGAAELYLQADMIKEAITAFISGEEWAKAKKVAAELEPKLLPYVEKKYKAHLKDKDSLDVLESVDVDAALRGYITKGNWNKALTVAENKAPELLPKYVTEYTTKLIQEKNLVLAIEVFVRYGTPATPKNFQLYKRMFHSAINAPKMDNQESFKVWSGLRDMFHALIKQPNQLNGPELELFQNVFLVSHYYATKFAMNGHETLIQSASKISVSLLRHIDLIPADKAFYEAGHMCRETGQEEFALLLFNRFLDVVEAIEDPSSVDLGEHPLISETDIPSDFPIPEEPHVSASDLEEVKEWVLAMSMDQKLSADDYPRNGKGFYVGGLLDFRTMERFSACVLTGYPVLNKEVSFKKEDCQALKEDWNKFITAIKMTRSPELCNVFEFIGEWCGISQHHTTGFSAD